MNISDKKFIEFADRIWERNKELIEENRDLKQDILQYVDRINKLKDELEFEKAFSRDSHSQNIKLRKDLEEVNARCNDVMDEQYNYIRKLEEENQDLALANDCLSDSLDDILLENDDSLGEEDRFINCTFNLYFE